ncbi:hypothetical protein Tco_0255273 [Tanacetum coccineum]
MFLRKNCFGRRGQLKINVNGQINSEQRRGESNASEVVRSDTYLAITVKFWVSRASHVRFHGYVNQHPLFSGFHTANDFPNGIIDDITWKQNLFDLLGRSGQGSNSRVLEGRKTPWTGVSSERFCNGLKIKEGGLPYWRILEKMITAKIQRLRKIDQGDFAMDATSSFVACILKFLIREVVSDYRDAIMRFILMDFLLSLDSGPKWMFDDSLSLSSGKASILVYREVFAFKKFRGLEFLVSVALIGALLFNGGMAPTFLMITSFASPNYISLTWLEMVMFISAATFNVGHGDLITEVNSLSQRCRISFLIVDSCEKRYSKDVRSMFEMRLFSRTMGSSYSMDYKIFQIKGKVLLGKLYLDRLYLGSNLSRGDCLACRLWLVPLCESRASRHSSHLFFGCLCAKDIPAVNL